MTTVKQYKNKFLVLITLLFVSSCASIYQKEGFFTNGYSDLRLGSDRFAITFHANEHTDPEVVYNFALRRAAEVTLKRGYRYFIVLETKDSHSKGNGPVLHYPSIQLTIQCFLDAPIGFDAIDARFFYPL